MSANKKKNDDKPAVPDHEVRQESSKNANCALQAQRKAQELKDAAAGAGDPEERQKLMERAINAQIEAESFGKTAKYLRSGTFQGLAVGTGLGVAPGATLGAVTGTLVGGITSTITGGLGGGVGALTGALHGPFWDLGKMAGRGVQKVTGNFPGWVASEEQKKAFEKMIGQAQEEDMPDESELEKLRKDGGGGGEKEDDEGWINSAKEAMPAKWSTDSKSSTQDAGEGKAESQSRKKPRKLNQPPKEDSANNTEPRNRKTPRKLEVKANSSNTGSSKPTSTKGKPRKLENRSDGSSSSNNNNNNNNNNSNTTPMRSSTRTKAQPRKLEQRSS
ncbi:uncharacterized protein K460DRAFT_367645 [Cucurbitaria berberidis CBS 394.84]|uniref:Glycine zipper domain-containing protein n=1 Tax=Cucurbitaria berberidis CBS 394.84 TaxID=1168544 RepID=A0A9P4GBS7_9PLEO|nr:uncharacterized protein K460DRAFT_367645 [Cucurbitaria berberidis CBS 394.84]KAF1842685.1 hypothetical protein K460DRAFT_367645 [Cucurbitaria berberidis CBS 394.84]